jgi:hypothetical protein
VSLSNHVLYSNNIFYKLDGFLTVIAMESQSKSIRLCDMSYFLGVAGECRDIIRLRGLKSIPVNVSCKILDVGYFLN